jgi:ferredoxin-NADP reductase
MSDWSRRLYAGAAVANLAGTVAVVTVPGFEALYFLASGTGIIPMLSMLRQYFEEGAGHAHIGLGEKREETIIHRGTLNERAADHTSLNATFTLSDHNWEWTGRAGYVQEHLGDLFEDFQNRDFYVCGVPPMVVETKDRLRDLGAPEARIHSEGWEDGVVGDN